MPPGTPLTQRARHGEPQPAPFNPAGATEEPMSSKRDLKSWWKNFSRGNQKRDDEKGTPQLGIFGIPLQTSVRYANVAISLQDAEGNSYVYGYVPIVVAKCGVFLKEKATDVEGIFRLSGSEKRIKELKEAFNSPDRYGKGLDWTGYTVHDAANILRRYFNQLPEPIIPLEFYERFRDPLRSHQSQAVGQIEGQSPSVGDFDHETTIRIYQNIITELPPLNRQLLLYILDLLAVFASKSDLNKMTTPNLAAIFQPGILSHPSHDMAPPEYRLSQDVLIFLIENQDHFLIGMPGTGADEKTKEEVESGPPTPAVARSSKGIVGRSSSGASKYSGVRRSVSVSSRQSRGSVAPSPISPGTHTPTSGGVHRSNTVPSKHSPRTSHSRFQRDQPSGNSSPITTPMYTPAEMPGAYPGFGDPSPGTNGSTRIQPASPGIISPSSSESATPLVPPSATDPNAQLAPPNAKQARPDSIEIPSHTRSLPLQLGQETPPTGTSTPRGLAAIFAPKVQQADVREGDRKPKKLQKKRLPGSSNPSAHSSSHSLDDAPAVEQMSVAPSTASNAPLLAPQITPTHQAFLHPSSTDPTPLKPPPPIGLKADPPMSPAHSYRSHSEFTEGELDDVQPLDHQGPVETSDRDLEPPEGGKRRRFWERKKGESISYSSHNPSPNVEAQRSRSSVLSGGAEKEKERRSLALDRNMALNDPESAEREKEKNPLHWIKGKLAERAEKKEEKKEQKRAKSPPPAGESGHNWGPSGSMQSLGAATAAAGAARDTKDSGFSSEISTRGKSVDIRRDGRSMDIPRDQVFQPKKSMDAGPGTANTGHGNGPAERDRQRSLLNIGEDAVAAKKAAQLAVARNAENSGI